MKISVYDKEMSILTGETVSGEKLYKHFGDISCSAKLVANVDTGAFLRDYDASTSGTHQVTFYGNWR